MHCPHCTCLNSSVLIRMLSKQLRTHPVTSDFAFFAFFLPFIAMASIVRFFEPNMAWADVADDNLECERLSYVEATIRLLDTQDLHCHCSDVRGIEKVLMQQETLERPRPRSVRFRPVGHTYIAPALPLLCWQRCGGARKCEAWGCGLPAPKIFC